MTFNLNCPFVMIPVIEWLPSGYIEDYRLISSYIKWLHKAIPSLFLCLLFIVFFFFFLSPSLSMPISRGCPCTHTNSFTLVTLNQSIHPYTKPIHYSHAHVNKGRICACFCLLSTMGASLQAPIPFSTWLPGLGLISYCSCHLNLIV